MKTNKDGLKLKHKKHFQKVMSDPCGLPAR